MLTYDLTLKSNAIVCFFTDRLLRIKIITRTVIVQKNKKLYIIIA